MAGWVTPPKANYKTEAGWLKGIYAANKHNFSSYKEFRQTAAKDILFETHTKNVGRYGLKAPRGKMSKEEYLEKVFAYNKEKIVKAYEGFAGKAASDETVFKRFKQEYNLREQYIYGRTGRKLGNRSEVLNALQRSDFFNTTEQRQRFTLLEEMKITKTGKRSNMLKDFLRDTGYSNMHEIVDAQNMKNYYIHGRVWGNAEGMKEKQHITTYFFRGRDGSMWEVVVTNSPVTIEYRQIGESEI